MDTCVSDRKTNALRPTLKTFACRMRRSRWASKDLMKQALKQARVAQPKKVKNVKTSALGETLGQLHMQRQDYGKLQTRKVKGLHAQKAAAVGVPEGSQTVGKLEKPAYAAKHPKKAE